MIEIHVKIRPATSWVLILGCLYFIATFHSASAQQTNLNWLINTSSLENKDAIGLHPRGLILPDELPALRAKVRSGKLDKYLEKVIKEKTELEEKINDLAVFDAKLAAQLAEYEAILYLLTGEKSYAEKAFENLEKVFDDHLIFNNPVSRGLTRATMLKSMALTYDFCYNGWQQEERNLVNRQLYKIIYATQANMGFDANYSLVSNWMGVRWGASLFAGLVWDNPDTENRSIADPLIWDATKRLKDHLAENIYPQGWNAESIGYHQYNWSFVGPALIAFQNKHQGKFSLETMAPQAIQSLKAMAAAIVSIRIDDRVVGLKPDLSDDNLNIGDGFFGMNLRLYPEDQVGSINWMHDYLGENSLYTALYDTEELKKENPRNLEWLNHADSIQGIVIFRNQFEGPEDVVALLNLSSNRVAGHNGPDVNTFRIIAGGVPLVIGAGRTGMVAGQTNLFTGVPDLKQSGDNTSGELLDFAFSGNGSGYGLGKGSSMGVENQLRKFTVSYDPLTGAEAVFLVEDFSDNAKIWRLNTPEFNEVELLEDGFIIKTPTGFSLKAMVLNTASPIQITKQKVRYGGDTQRLNLGILWGGESYSYSTAIDILIAGDIQVLMTLQSPEAKIPEVQISLEGFVKVGQIKFLLLNPDIYENY